MQLNLEQLKFRGISPAQVMSAMQTAYEGHMVGKTFNAIVVFNVAGDFSRKIHEPARMLAARPAEKCRKANGFYWASTRIFAIAEELLNIAPSWRAKGANRNLRY